MSCGTDAGYHRHRRAGQRACLPCREAHAEVNRKSKSLVVKEFDPEQCGTNQGYNRHVAAREPACRECKDAHTYYERERRRSRGESSAPDHKAVRRMRTLVKLPVELFAELYWTASPKALDALDELLGPEKVDKLIKQADKEQEPG